VHIHIIHRQMQDFVILILFFLTDLMSVHMKTMVPNIRESAECSSMKLIIQ